MNSRLPLAFSVLLAAVSAAPAHAQWWNPADPIGPGKRGTIAEPKVVYTSRLYEQAKMTSNAFLIDAKVVELERMYDEFMAGNARSTDGRYMVQAIQDNVAGTMGAIDERRAANMFKAWEAKAPQSKLRPILLAVMHQAQAWKARGGAYGSSGEGAQLFRERLRLAAQALAESKQAGKDSPIWWWVSLIVAGSSGASPAQMDAIFEEAVKLFPTYQPLYYTRLNYLLPQWGGSAEAVQRFVAASVERTTASEGQGMYAWLYIDLATKTCCGPEDMSASWPPLNAALHDLVTRHPDTLNKNYYGSFACRARDKETTARLLQELGGAASFGVVQGITAEGCRRFAFTGT